MGGKSSLLRAGLSVFKTFETKNGSITPLADLDYLDAMDGDSELFSNGVVVRERHVRFGLPRGARPRRPLQGLGHHRAGRTGGHHGVPAGAALTNVTVRYRW